MLLDLVLTTPAAAAPVSRDEVKTHLRVDHADEDELIDAAIAAAVAALDGYSGTLGRALGSQTWTLHLARFPAGRLTLPLPPLISVTSIAYVDPDGESQTLAADQYVMLAGPVASVEPAHGLSWPSTRAQSRAVTIVFVAGYAAVPAPIRSALLLMIGDLYANRETGVTGTVAAEIKMSTTVRALLAPYRVPRT